MPLSQIVNSALLKENKTMMGHNKRQSTIVRVVE